MTILHETSRRKRYPAGYRRGLMALLLCCVAPLASAASVAGYVLDIQGNAAAVQVVHEGQTRALQALEPLYPGMRITVAPGQARATLDLNGTRQVVSADNSPLLISEPDSNPGVGGNLVSWAMSLLGRDEDVLRSVGAVSRSTQHTPMPWLPTAEPSQVAIGDMLFFVWRGAAPPDVIRLHQDGTLIAEHFMLPALQLALLPLPPVTPGEYALTICFGDDCRRHPVLFTEAPSLPPGAPDAAPGDGIAATDQALYLLQRGGPSYWLSAVQHIARYHREQPLAEALFLNISGR
ncbi:hypothetical protein K8B33_04020 [Alcanivorax sp. JB21]|uniref:hypothetical protein n=1 Tax=Alcanivorax limicola TaxID=2874102 RepID=UPI001CC1B8B9|nr:hypothetical protein [Alcanivorax limicola]MBZ2188248.1 hypothetical protein [Alcanivorax limicola]